MKRTKNKEQTVKVFILSILAVLYVNFGLSVAPAFCSNPETDLKKAEEEVTLGLIQIKKHDWKQAFVHFDNAVKLNPKHQLAWANHGTCHLNLGRSEKAIESYNKAQKLDPKDPYVYCSLGSANRRLSRDEEAISHIDKAIAIDSLFYPALMNKAGALKSLGRIEEAKKFNQMAIKINPEMINLFEEK